MSDPIRTPDDEVDKPGWFLPPFKPGAIYHGATYPGHSDFATDWNRRSPSGAWLQDEGDPVHAAADGAVREVVKADGLVEIAHAGGWSTEYRHMRPVSVKVGDKVQRGDVIGKIGNVAGSGSSFGPHLHMRAYRDGKPVQLRFAGVPVATSVEGSNGKPPTWDPPAPVAVVGPPPRATWEGAYREAAKRLDRAEERIAARDARIELVESERDAARAEAERLKGMWQETEAALLVCMARPDTAALEADNDRLAAELAEATAAAAQDRAARDVAIAALDACEDASAPLEAFVADVQAAERKRVEATV